MSGQFGVPNQPATFSPLLNAPVSHHVTVSTADEVYTFGATVNASWAKQWPRDYKAEPANLTAPDIYIAITDPVSLRAMPDGWPSSGTCRTLITLRTIHRATMSAG